MSGLCRDCPSEVPDGRSRCPACGSPRVVHHPELHALTIAHIDCDAFYAAIEKRDDPSLADKPLIIGGGKRGVVATACYIARTYGVRRPPKRAGCLADDAARMRAQLAHGRHEHALADTPGDRRACGVALARAFRCEPSHCCA